MTIDPFRWLRIAAYVVLLVLSLALLQAAHGQVAVIPFQSPNVQFFDGNGKPLASGCVFTYQAGTTTPQTSYSDSAGTVPNANPIILDGSGRATIWFAMPAYKYIAKSFGGTACASGSTVVTVDNISEKFFRTDAGNALVPTADPAAALGLFWLSSTNAGFLKWSDASAIHTIVGADSTQTISNKTYTGTSLAVTGLINSSSPSAGIGYSTGAGCSITQTVNKTAAVACVGMSGAITTSNSALGATTSVGFTVSNSSVLATDVIMVSIRSGATVDSYTVMVDTVAASSFRISLRNYTGGGLSEAVIINFVVLRAANS